MANTYSSPITFNGKEAMEYIMAPEYRSPLIDFIHTIVPGIKAKEQLAWAELWDDQIFLLNSGCGSGQVSKDVDLTEKFWNPKDIKAWTQTCWDTFKSSLFVWSMKNGVDKMDIDGTVLGDFITEQMAQSVWRQVFNIAWFGDTSAALVTASPAGHYKSGTTITYHNIMDGFWEQIFDGVTATTVKRYTITYNALTGYTNQLALAGGYSKTVLQAIYNNADERLLGRADAMMLVTRTLWQNWIDYRASITTLESSWSQLENGIMTSSYMGVPIVPILEWDRYIKNYLDDGTSYYLPHRAVFTTKSNLNIGMDAVDAPDAFKAYLDDTTELYNVKSAFRMDVKLFREELCSVAY